MEDNNAFSTIKLLIPQSVVSLLESLKHDINKLIDQQNKSVWLDEDEAANRLKVSKSVLQRWRKEGWLRHYRDGEKVIIYKQDQLDQDVEKKLLVKRIR